MDTDHLRTFLDVCAAGSFAQAARLRRVDASTISRMVAALEGELGVRLFHRTTRHLHTTSEGERLRSHAERVCTDMAALRESVRDATGEARGLLRITASSSFGLEVLAPLLPGFHAAHPGVDVELDLSDHRVDVVEAGVDIALRHGRLADSSLVASRLMDVRYRLVAAPAYLSREGEPRTPPAIPEDLAAHRLLTFTHAGFRDRWQLRRQGGGDVVELVVTPVLRASSAVALRRCARAGLGVAILPDWALGRMDGLVEILPDWDVAGPDFGSAIWLMRPSRAHTPRRVGAFVDYLKVELGLMA